MKTQLFLFIAAMMLLASCRSSKEISETGGYVGPQCITSKISMKIEAKGHNISVSGSIKMKRDDVVRIQVVPMGLFEMARLEMTKDEFLVVDRMGNRYARAPYSDVALLRERGYNFETLQKMFWEMTTSADKKTTVEVPEKKMKVTITMQSPKEDCDWETRTNLSSRYEQVTVNALLKSILSLL